MGIKWDLERQKLDKIEPFTDSEKASYQKRDLDFIRNIQISKGVSKAEAKKEFNKYLNSSPKSKYRLKLRNFVRAAQKNQSPPTHAPPTNISSQKTRVAPTSKKGKKEGAKTVKEAIKKSKAKTLPNQIKISKRLINAEKKYPNASVQELRHGVNSKWSQEWRLKHGQGRYYEK